MSKPATQARSTARRVRRKLARLIAPELESELLETRRKLKATRTQLRRARDEAAYDLPQALEETIGRVRAEHLTYLKPNHLRDLASIVLAFERRKVPGLLIEAGAARGGSAIVIAAAKSPARPMKVYDVFGMIPAPGERDGADVHERYEQIAVGAATGVGGETYYGYREDLYGEVTESFARLGVPADANHVELIQGLFEDTIQLDEPVAFAHLDGDWYDSTMTCLTRIAPLLVPGGRIVLDDYNAWSGCRTAVDEYFADRPGFTLRPGAKMHVIRDSA